MEKPINYRFGVEYKLYTYVNEPEELDEETRDGEPFRFLSGFGMVLEDFENNISSLSVGDTFDFKVPMDRAYGE